jgi:hypothetical protein
MPLPEPRKGKALGFGLYPDADWESTLGIPEAIIWSGIHHLYSRSAAEYYAAEVHGIARKNDRATVATSVKLYVQQASEFYEAAATAKPNTAPLIYYYSFLNLAKALCEFRNPRFHSRPECYAHGLSWRPDPQKVVNLEKETVTLRGRGVWQVLWETMTKLPYSAANPTQIPVQKLFSYCHEISAEYGRVMGFPTPLVPVKEPQVFVDEELRESWLRFSVERTEFKDHRLSAPKLISQIRIARSSYVEVKSKKKNMRTFQSETAKKMRRRETVFSGLEGDILGLNLFASLDRDRDLRYSIPLQGPLPLRLPQLMVSYTILFWLGSLVRYDPHSVYELMDSPFWILIDGFMSQSRVWLLELFWWALFRKETTLLTAR